VERVDRLPRLSSREGGASDRKAEYPAKPWHGPGLRGLSRGSPQGRERGLQLPAAGAAPVGERLLDLGDGVRDVLGVFGHHLAEIGDERVVVVRQLGEVVFSAKVKLGLQIPL